MITEAEKTRIVTALNRRYACDIDVPMAEIAVHYGFTSWDTLRRDADERLSPHDGAETRETPKEPANG